MSSLTPLDWFIVVASLVVAFAPALWLARRAGSSTAEFFTSGQSAPWWLVGISMVATTFSTDTPNLVADIVRRDGVAGNWVWWAFLLTGMATVFFFARLWRRAGLLTDLEFYELRYSGRAASFVRGFRAVYLGLFFNAFIMAAVNLAAVKIANVLFGWPMGTTLLVCAAISIVFAATSGLWGVMVTDMIQFGIAMTGAVAAAVYALHQPEVGGLDGLMARLPEDALRLVPDPSNGALFAAVFLIPLTVQWWSVWYPGAEPGGGSYIAQRILASRSEADAIGGTLLFNIAHYALRPWPWILVALASLLVYPDLAALQTALPHVDPKLVGHDMAYPAMVRFLPPGLLGLMVAGMLAAYVSTISTHLNWGTSYLVHDVYRRFVRADAPEAHYVQMGRIVTAALMVLAAALTFVLDSAKQAFDLLLSIGAGTGLLYLLRWFWWRINAWCEVAAMAASFLVALGFFALSKQGVEVPTHVALPLSVGLTTAVWLLAAFFGPSTRPEQLAAFYAKVRPAGPGWAKVRAETGLPPSPDSLPQALLAWTLGLFTVYGVLFGAGLLLYGDVGPGVAALVVGLAAGAGLARMLRAMQASG